MKILEFEAKALLTDAGLPVPKGSAATSPDEAADMAHLLRGPAVVKAQVPTGGRMKAGGIRFAATPDDARSEAEALLALDIRGFPVDIVLVEQRVESAREVYVAATYDAAAGRAVLVASVEGGIDVEATQAVVRREFSLRGRAPDYLGREIAAELGFGGPALPGLAAIIAGVARCFAEWDALLLELNPVVQDTSGAWWVADAHLEIDDDAIYRQSAVVMRAPESVRAAERRTEFERRAHEIDSADHRGVAGRLIPFDGDLGLLMGGGGASLTILDAVLDAGLEPANYCELGGNPSVWKVKEMTRLILSRPGVERVAVIMNVVSNTRVDLMARGVIKGALELGLNPADVITAFRVPGSWEDEGEKILNHYGIPHFGRETTIDAVVEAIR